MITSFPQEGRLKILRPDSNRGLKVIYVVSKAVHEWKRWFMCVVFFHLLISHHGGVFPLTVSKIGSNKITVKGKRRSTTFRQITNLVSVNNNFYHLYTSILLKYLKHKSLSLLLKQTKRRKVHLIATLKVQLSQHNMMGFPTHPYPRNVNFLSQSYFSAFWAPAWLSDTEDKIHFILTIVKHITNIDIDFCFYGSSVLFREEYQS